MKQRNLMIEKILELVSRQGVTGDEQLKEFESKANCKLTEMNLNVLKRVYTLLNAS
jgi:hypothetical protein